MHSKPRRFRSPFKYPLPITKLIPNVLTLLALSIGISSVRFAMEHKWELAIYCTIIAAIIDGLDGRIARLLNSTSIFGAELDSLCDFVNFGVAPAITTYIFLLPANSNNLLIWGVAVIYIICMGIRLARFNTAAIHSELETKHSKMFFVGVPAPIGALLALIPIMLHLDIAKALDINIQLEAHKTIVYLLFVGFLLASRLPTISIKHLSIKPEYIWISLLTAGALTVTTVIYPWYMIPLLGAIYLASIPLAAFYAKRFN